MPQIAQDYVTKLQAARKARKEGLIPLAAAYERQAADRWTAATVYEREDMIAARLAAKV